MEVKPWAYELAKEIEEAGYGEKGKIVTRYAATLGLSEKSVYRELKKLNDGKRKTRSDAGATVVSDEVITLTAALLLNSVRENGKVTMSVATARQILETQGYEINVSNSRLATLIKEKGYDLNNMKDDTPCVRMRSLHPNHVHQADPSLSLLYYTPEGKQHTIDDSEAYKNKPFMEGKEKLKLWRYVLVDHYSGMICHRYYQTPGENSLVLWEFLQYCWNEKECNLMPFYGLPKILIWDKGSANTSQEIKNACKALKIETIAHTVKNARAKGSVEKANHIIETEFESRLKLQPVTDVDALNKKAEIFDAYVNANMLKVRDTRLSRSGKKYVRTDLWMKIKAEDLRELPEDLAGIYVKDPAVRIVNSDLTISFAHPRIGRSCSYSVAQLEGVYPKLKVEVVPILMSMDGKVLVSFKNQKGEIVEDELFPLEIDEAGFRIDAPVFGLNFKSNPDTVVDKARKQLKDLIGDSKKPFIETIEGGGIKAIDAIMPSEDGIIFMPKRAVKMESPKPAIRLSIVEASRRIHSELGYFDSSIRAYLVENYSDGVLETEMPSLIEKIKNFKKEEECIS